MEKIVIVYYTYTNHTKEIAEQIHKKIGGDMVAIETVLPYSGSYQEVVDQGNEEVKKGFKPKIKKIELDFEKYDTIVLGTPVWWYTMAPAVLTFLSEYSLDNKRIVPFATNGGWLGHTFEDIKKCCKTCQIDSPMDIRYSGDQLVTPMKEIQNWIDKI